MHPAPIFKVEATEPIIAHLGRYPLATIVAAPAGRMMVAQAPVLVRELAEGLALDFHLSRNNTLISYLTEGFSAVAVSLGPEAYISPDWYAAADQVPTWNYVSAEAEGTVMALGDADLVAMLDDLSTQEEARLAPKPPWTRAKMSPGRFEAMTRAIVGARLVITRLEASFKLSQNKNEADRSGVISALGDLPMAEVMKGAM